jgi:hypothetical protein
MVTDRPGVTNGPYTVAPGHLQVETGVLNYTYDHATRLSRVDVFGGTELRVGLVDRLEFAVTLNPFSWQRQDGQVTTGFGDTTLQGKWTIWSDATGAAAIGVIPFVTFNTAQHNLGAGGTQGGMYFPIALSLPANFGLGMMPGVFAAPNSASGGTHAQVVGTINLSHPIVGTLSAFGEFAANVDVKHPSDWVGTIDFGLVYLITPNLQVDTGMNVGVTRAAPDLNPFVGLSARF